jgi:hypothetical protein
MSVQGTSANSTKPSFFFKFFVEVEVEALFYRAENTSFETALKVRMLEITSLALLPPLMSSSLFLIELRIC